MKELERMLKQEEKRLQRIQDVVNKRLSNAPEGTLRVSNSGKYSVFLLATDESRKNKKKGDYISKSDTATIKSLAQKAYDKKIKRIVDRRLKQLQTLNSEYRDNEILEVYESLTDVRKQLVSPVEPLWEQKVSEWRSIPYIGKEFSKDIPLI